MAWAGNGVRAGAAWGLVAAAAVAGAGQERYPIFTADQFVETMRTVGPNVAAARRALDNGDLPTAKAQLVRSREQLATTITFWRDRQQEEAIGYLREAVRALDAIDDALSREPVDHGAVDTLTRRLDAACAACHGTYREGDAAAGYRFGPAVAPQAPALPVPSFHHIHINSVDPDRSREWWQTVWPAGEQTTVAGFRAFRADDADAT